MITTDAHSGLRAALKTEFGGVPWQRCQFHLQQNAMSYVTKLEMRKEVAEDIRSILNSPNLLEAERMLKIIIAKHKPKLSKLTTWMEENFHESFTCFLCPAQYRKRLRTSNMAEVCNREIKRRTRVISIFPSESSLLRICSAYLKSLDERWDSNRAYLSMQ